MIDSFNSQLRLLHENGRIAHAVKRMLEIFYSKGHVEIADMLESALTELQLAMLDEQYSRNRKFKERASKTLDRIISHVGTLKDHDRFAWRSRLYAIQTLIVRIDQSGM